MQAEVLAARGAVDVHAAIQAVASASPTANLVRNAAHAVAQGLPGELSAAPQIVQPCGCHPDASEVGWLLSACQRMRSLLPRMRRQRAAA